MLERLVRQGAVPQALSELLGDYEHALRDFQPRPTAARRKNPQLKWVLPRWKPREDEAQPLREAAIALDGAVSACETVNQRKHCVPAESILGMRRLSQMLEEVAELRVIEDWPLARETVAIERHIAASTGKYRDVPVSVLLNAVHEKMGLDCFERTPEALDRFRRQHSLLYKRPGQFDLNVLLGGERCASSFELLDVGSRRRSAEHLPVLSRDVNERRASS